MAQEQIAWVAERFWKTMLMAKPRLPAGIQKALDLRTGTADISWAVALVLAGWRLLKQQDARTRTILQETGVLSFITQLDAFERLVPSAFMQFLQTAEGSSGESSLAGAAFYLQAAFEEMMEFQRNAFVQWATGGEFRKNSAALAARFPQPNLGLEPTFHAPAPPALSRIQRFDRAERPARRPASPRGPTLVDCTVPAPCLSPEEVTRAHLHAQGWDIAAADRILSGPKGHTGPLLRVRQLMKTYAALATSECMVFQKLVDESEQAFTLNDVKAIKLGELLHLSTVEPLPIKTGAELFRAYRERSIPDRQRVLAYILTTETRFTPAEMNAVSLANIPAKDLE